ncbi:MAG: PQQ-dependent sugar dehydrogenase [Gammaproteobacteria bacterium]|nr:PQQ-dependent sugar dehydrogenase [Gammaproteobacteria bacterium]NIR84739.1 PQQ-dependent sugar dehydrogenase [Gammaproteobacteria bacterium]NIR91235.1 PQQ-dependent sugar dehydrogenase [Gammaproteobacteria bacterium]NIU05782.1 PQQ-dependent sugar dehydrogenase [Gammaproteobacteria bacterium]NIV52901.1 CHRD domain-containing protein [Gammaproteobacteria bacterium]
MAGKLLCSIVFASSLAVIAGAAHAEHGAVFETTVFAPIHAGGTTVTLETVATGLTAPVKAVAAPGLPEWLFVVDQAGTLWALNLAAGAPVSCPSADCQVFLDVGPAGLGLIVPLGVVGPGTFDERGLLGLAFHPDYQSNGLFYTYTSEPASSLGPPTFPSTVPPVLPPGVVSPDHQNAVSEWEAVDPADPSAGVMPGRRVLMHVDWPQFNHNAGDVVFGPDDLLYISMGDGGGADDRDEQLFVQTGTGGMAAPIVGHGLDGNAQKLTNPLGKILRIDPDGSNSANGQYGIPPDNPFVGDPTALDEIFAYGLRNPFRFSFDSATDTLVAGDVGQNDLEEVNVVESGANHGWPIKEGTQSFNHNGNDEGYACNPDTGPFPCPVPMGDLVDPIAQYDTHEEGHAVVGGFVYRGEAIPQLAGRYVFGDFAREFGFPGPNETGRALYLQQKKLSKSGLLNVQEFNVQGQAELGMTVLGFGQDASGEVYYLGNLDGLPFGTEGLVLRLAPVSN